MLNYHRIVTTKLEKTVNYFLHFPCLTLMDIKPAFLLKKTIKFPF